MRRARMRLCFFLAIYFLVIINPIKAQSEQAEVTFRNNTSQPVTFYVGDDNYCRIFVRYGYQQFYFSPGTYVFTAKNDNGDILVTEAVTVESGYRYEWSVSE